MAEVDPESGGLATPNCPKTQMDYFIEGTQPTFYCPIHTLQNLPHIGALDHLANNAAPVLVLPAPSGPQRSGGTAIPAPPPVASTGNPPAEQDKQKKKGFFGRIIGVLKGD